MCLAVPGKIVSVHEKDPLFRLGVVDFGGVTREVNLAACRKRRWGVTLLCMWEWP